MGVCCKELRRQLEEKASASSDRKTRWDLYGLVRDLEIYCEEKILARYDHHATKLVAEAVRPLGREFAEQVAKFSKEKHENLVAEARAILGLTQ